MGMGGDGERNRLNWKRLADEIDGLGVYMHVPAVSFLVGEFVAAAPKQKKERKRKERTQSEPQQTAETVTAAALQEQAKEKAQTARMIVMQKKVAELSGKDGSRGRVNMFHLVLHPTSFSQSVENLFDLAFLVKDGKVSIESDADCAYVRGAKQPEADAYEHGLVKKQNILSFDHPTYRKLVQRWCSNGESLLPSRQGRAVAGSSQLGGGEGHLQADTEQANSQPSASRIDLDDSDNDAEEATQQDASRARTR